MKEAKAFALLILALRLHECLATFHMGSPIKYYKDDLNVNNATCLVRYYNEDLDVDNAFEIDLDQGVLLEIRADYEADVKPILEADISTEDFCLVSPYKNNIQTWAEEDEDENIVRSDIKWFSVRNKKTYERYLRHVDRLGLKDILKDRFVDADEVTVYSMAYIIRSHSVIHHMHWDWPPEVHTQIVTFLVPVNDIDVHLVYEDNDMEIQQYKYKFGKGIGFAGGFVHSTDVGHGDTEDVLLMIYLGSDDPTIWKHAQSSINDESEYYMSPLHGFVRNENLLKDQHICHSAATSDPKNCLANDETCLDNVNVQEQDAGQCTLYMAPSSISNTGLGIYTAVDIPEGSAIGEPDLFIPLLDRYKTLPHRGQHRWLSWLAYVRGPTDFFFNPPKVDDLDEDWFRRFPIENLAFSDDMYRVDAFAPGLASQVNGDPNCPFGMKDIEKNGELEAKDIAGLHLDKDPGAGAFTAHHGVTFSAQEEIPAGSELFVKSLRNFRKEPDWLKENGLCIDNLRPGQSIVKQAGRGAFAKRFISKGSLVSPAPLAVLKRDDLVIYEASEAQKEENVVLNKDKVLGIELLMNYCYGHPDSPLLLLPLSPIVNFINHNGTAPNAAIRWPEKSALGNPKAWLSKHPLDLLEMSGELMMEFIAVRDILPGEEIFIDYGKGWQEAWDKHVEEWSPKPEHKEYVSAADYLKSGAFTVLTEAEQKKNPYPNNLQTACIFIQRDDEDGGDCFYPCTVVSRNEVGGDTYEIRVSRELHGADAKHFARPCVLPDDELIVSSMPSQFITVFDKRRSSDQHLDDAFRHEIGVPDDFSPAVWMQPAIYEVALPKAPLKPGEFFQMTWAHNGETVQENGFLVGLPANFSAHMRDYCDRMGITDIYRKVLNDEPVENNNYYVAELTEGKAYVQRPDSKWGSNMHFVIPQDEVARVSLLRALGSGGFDVVLEGAAKSHPWLDGLTCFHNTILGVSKCRDSYMHSDFEETGRKSFNFVFPIYLANESEREIDIQSDDGNIVAGVTYQYDVAVDVGDSAYHKTAAADYTATREIRMVASIYCSDMSEDNLESLFEQYIGEHPAPFYHQFKLPVKEWHWGHGENRLPV